MFDCTLDSSWDERSRFGLTTLTSFSLQALVVGVLLVLPMLRPQGLPSFRQLSTPISLGQPLADPVERTHASSNVAANNFASITFRRPATLPTGKPAPTDEGPPQTADSGPYVPGAMGKGDPRGVSSLFGDGSRPILPVAPAAAAPLRVSHISEGNLIRKVQPTYPALARTARIQGQVVLQAVISKEGAIENLKVLAGHPMLAPAAVEAVSQWRYRPYVLNSEPVEVETQITVNFSLAGN